MSGRSVKSTFLAAVALFAPDVVGRADVIKLTDRPALQAVDVTDFSGGAIRFRGVTNVLFTRPLNEVEWLDLEESPQFSDAELARVAGLTAEALKGYLAVAERPPSAWVGRLAQTRVIQLSDDAGRFDAAVALYIEMLLSAPTADLSIRPRKPGPPGSPLNQRGREMLLAALESRPKPTVADALRSLLLEIGLTDGLEKPLDFTAEPAETATAEKPEELPALFGPERRAAAATTAAVYLPPDSLVWGVADQRLAAGDAAGALQLIDAARPWTRSSDKDRARLLRAQALLALDRANEALREARPLVENTDRATRDAALYHVGLASAQIGDVDGARAAWTRLAAETADLKLRATAEERLKSLQPAK